MDPNRHFFVLIYGHGNQFVFWHFLQITNYEFFCAKSTGEYITLWIVTDHYLPCCHSLFLESVRNLLQQGEFESRILEEVSQLFQVQGYHGTGLNKI
ncbi:hypothetical protein OKW24_004862 [Peribacillus simplex]|nr:hypothetical protein [Peribacillus simplex]